MSIIRWNQATLSTVLALVMVVSCSAQSGSPPAPALRLQVCVRGLDSIPDSGRGPTILCGQPLEVAVYLMSEAAVSRREQWLEAIRVWQARNQSLSHGSDRPAAPEFAFDDSLNVPLRTNAGNWWSGIRVEILRATGEGASGTTEMWATWIPWPALEGTLTRLRESKREATKLGAEAAEGTVGIGPDITDGLPDGYYEVRVHARLSDSLADVAVDDPTVLHASARFIVRKPLLPLEDLEASFRTAEYLFSRGAISEAASKYQHVIELDRTYWGYLAIARLGECWELAGDKQAAAAAYQDFLELSMGSGPSMTRTKYRARLSELESDGVTAPSNDGGY